MHGLVMIAGRCVPFTFPKETPVVKKKDEKQEAILDEPEGPPVEVPTNDVGHVKAALRVLSSDYGKRAKGLEEVHATKAATNVRADLGQLDELMPRVNDHGIAGLNEHQRDLARTAITLYVRNLRAARGTCTGISRSDWSAECDKTAADVEGRIAPMLDEQQKALTES